MAKRFNCWSDALGRPVTVIKPTENDLMQDDSSATINYSNDAINRPVNNNYRTNVPKKAIRVRVIPANKPKIQQNQRKILFLKHRCKVCGHDFGIRLMNQKNQKDIDDHMKKHTSFNEKLSSKSSKNEKRCNNICGYDYSKCAQKNIDDHENKHIDDKYAYKFQCKYCPRRYTHKPTLAKHIGTKHENWSCAMCAQKFESNRSLEHHIKNVHQYAILDVKEKFPRLYECFDCKQSFNRSIELFWHMNEHIDWLKEIDSIDMEKLFVCTICIETYAEKSLLMHHAATYHKIGSLLNCEICEMYFQTKAEFDEHRRGCVFEFEEHRDKCEGQECSAKLRCVICPQNFRNVDTLEIHFRWHTQENPYECIICDENFGQFFYFSRHLQDHLSVSNECSSTEKKTFECAWCEYSSSNYLLYTTHKKNHTNRMYECDYDCNESFDTQQKLIDHVQHSHNDDNQLKKYECKKCSIEFPLMILLLNHSLSHIKESEQYVCPECGKVFHGRIAMKTHKNIHLDETFQCSMCPKKFKSKKYLNNHMNGIHSSKNFTCDICNKVFNYHSSLRIHKLQKHQFGKRFQCETCFMSFYAKFHLQNHMRTHTGEKPYECVHCEKSFAQRGELSSHIRTHLGPTPHKCTQCNASFRLITELRKHSVKHFKRPNE